MDQHFKRILNLVRRTGDRMVVTDPKGEDAYVIMGLDAYESLLEAQEFSADLAAEQAVRRASTAETPPPSEENDDLSETTLQEQVEHDLRVWEAMHPAGGQGETWDMTKLTDEEKREVEQAYQNLHTKREEQKVEAPSVTQKDDGPGEEQFYLEPVE